MCTETGRHRSSHPLKENVKGEKEDGVKPLQRARRSGYTDKSSRVSLPLVHPWAIVCMWVWQVSVKQHATLREGVS